MADNTPPALDGHAPFAPSSASIWLECPYSVQLALDLHARGALPVKPSGVRALLGRLIHEYAERAVRLAFHHGGAAYAAWLSQCRPAITEFLRDAKPHARESDIEAWTIAVCAAVEAWVRAAFRFAGRVGPPHLRLVCPEYPVCIVPGWLQGTADLVITSITPARPFLTVLDLKTGRAEVAVEDNPQLLLYAAGAVESLRQAGVEITPTWTLTIGIVQPTRVADASRPPGHPLRYTRAYDTTVAAALALAERARALVERVVARQCTPAPGGHCQFCRVHDACPGYARNVLSVFCEPPAEPPLAHALRSVPAPGGALPLGASITTSPSAG